MFNLYYIKVCPRYYDNNITHTEYVGRSLVVCLINIIIDLTVDVGDCILNIKMVRVF